MAQNQSLILESNWIFSELYLLIYICIDINMDIDRYIGYTETKFLIEYKF